MTGSPVSLAFGLVILCLVTMRQTEGKDLPFTAEDCGTGDKIVSIRRFDINPKPLVLHLKTGLNVAVDMDVKKLVGPKIRAQVKVQKVMGRWNIPLLTIRKSFCDFLNDVTFKQILCPLFSKDGGQECTCPIDAGVYKTETATISLNLAKLPVPKLLYRLGSGNWQMEITAEEAGRQVACLRIRSHVKIQV